MLLRQLYLSHMEGERFEDALEAAREAYPLSEMPDVVCQDIARALLGSGKEAAAAVEMTRASRLGPPSRRAFHLWTLGSLYFLRGEYQLSASVFERAVRWGTTARPLYQAQLTLARRALGEPSVRLEEVQEQLEAAPCGQGYGRFVRGEIAFHLGQHSAARELLSSFVEGTRSGRKALQVGLSVELRHAVKILKDL